MWLIFECLKHLKAFYRPSLFLLFFISPFLFFENIDEGMETDW